MQRTPEETTSTPRRLSLRDYLARLKTAGLGTLPGTAAEILDDEIRDIREWDVVRIGPPVVRAFESGSDGLDLLAIGGPKPEGGDGVISDAPWPD